MQWRSQALKPGWAQGVWGTEVPPVGSRGGAPVEVWGRSLQKPDIYKQFAAVKCFLHRFIAESVLHLSVPTHLKKQLFGSTRMLATATGNDRLPK